MSPGATPAVTAPGNLFLFDNHFSDEIFPNIQCEPPLAQFEGFFPLFHHFLLEEQSQEHPSRAHSTSRAEVVLGSGWHHGPGTEASMAAQQGWWEGTSEVSRPLSSSQKDSVLRAQGSCLQPSLGNP